MKITWFSNSPMAGTGYGIETRLLTPRIKALGHDINILAFFGHEPYCTAVDWNGITITGRGFHPYGQDVLVPHAQRVQPDIVISLIDAWVMDMEAIKTFRWVPWFPIDAEPVPPRVLDRVRYAFARLVYSKFAESEMQRVGLDCTYIPHGVDTKIFAPLPKEQRKAWRQMFGLPVDAFMVGMVAANKGYPSRKAFEENIAAFKMLKDKHNDVILFLQTMAGENIMDAVDLPAYCRSIGLVLGRDVFFCDQFVNMTTGFPDGYMVGMYNAFDVLLSVSKGEGFGIPILEAQSCGTPVIVGDWTSMSELCFSGWKVDKSEANREFTKYNSFWFAPHPGAIYDRLEAAYKNRNYEAVQRRAREGALEYDADLITRKYWKPALESIAERIQTIERLKTLTSIPAPASAAPMDVKEITA